MERTREPRDGAVPWWGYIYLCKPKFEKKYMIQLVCIVIWSKLTCIILTICLKNNIPEVVSLHGWHVISVSRMGNVPQVSERNSVISLIQFKAKKMLGNFV